MAWAKAIVELSGKYKDVAIEQIEIPIIDMVEKMFKYYWDQTIFFNLYQSAPSQPPVILSEIKKMIALYQKDNSHPKPIVFIKAENKIKTKYKEEYDKAIKNSISNVKRNVMPYFLNLNSEVLQLYKIYSNSIGFDASHLVELYNNQQDLFDLINYRWSLMLEDYNSSPRIGKKVRIMDEQKIKRSPLTKFDKYLDLENKEHICFICGEQIDDKELSRDHVIPWSYMCSDDLWNLVYVHRSCNSLKSNRPPNDEQIKKLKERNLRLQSEIRLFQEKQQGKEGLSALRELDFAIEKDYVDKFYLSSKGC